MFDGASVVFRAIVRTNDVVIGEAPEEVGDMVVKMVVTSCEALVGTLVDVAAELASVRDAVPDELCCELTTKSPATA